MGSNVSSFLLSSAAYNPAMLAGFLRFSLLSTSLQCSYHLLVLLCLSLRMLPFLSFTVAQRVCLWLRDTLVWGKKVFMCCCRAAFSDSLEKSLFQRRLSILTCLFISLFFFLSVFILPSLF